MPTVPDVPCTSCGKLLWRGTGSLPKPTCRECRRKNPKRYEPKVPTMRTCKVCGSTFSSTHPLYVCCSGECRSKYHATWLATQRRQCETCSSSYTPSYGPQRFCSLTCRPKRSRPKGTQRAPRPSPSQIRSLIWIKDCKRCGRAFIARQPNKVFCTVTCRVGDTSARIVSLYSMAVEHGGPGGARWRKALCELLVERDGPDCAICGDSVNLNTPSGPKGHDLGPSVDHIIPRSLGGPDELDNLRLTHWGCNRKRGNRVA